MYVIDELLGTEKNYVEALGSIKEVTCWNEALKYFHSLDF